MKAKYLLIASALTLSSLAQTVYTIPQGYTRVTLEGDSSPDSTPFSVFSVTLLQDVEFSGLAALGSFADAPDTQTLTVPGVTWTADQFTTEPHIAYVSVADDANNADGIAPAEKPFLILDHTQTGGLTLSTDSDLSTEFPSNSAIKIRRANTLKTLFNSVEAEIDGADRVYLYDEETDAYSTFRFVSGGGGLWINLDGNTNATNMVVFPEEGLFYGRAGETPLTLTLFGEVPSAPQIATVPGNGFLSSRVPVDTTLIDLGIQDSGWQVNDRLFIWDPTATDAGGNLQPSFTAHRFVTSGGGIWIDISDNSNATNKTISANSAVYIVRASPQGAGEGIITTGLPYSVE